MSKVLVIIPAFNEEESILDVVGSLSSSDVALDYVVINDASTDNTEKILNDNKINHISLPFNLGIGGAVQTGYVYAYENGYDIAIQMDGDGQHPATEISKLTEPILKGEADMTVGSRFVLNDSFRSTQLRRTGIKLLSNLIYLKSKQRILDVTSGFRAVNKDVIALFSKEYAQDYPEPESLVIASKHKAKIKEVPVIMKERSGGVSSISPLKSIYYMIKVSLAILLGDN